jgi:2,5-diketo-D-gluconate reductase A
MRRLRLTVRPRDFGQGRVRAIGVSNFGPRHLQDLIGRTGMTPAVNQVELNPFFVQQALREANVRHGIITQSWAPIGGTYRRNPKAAPTGVASPLDHPAIVKLAEKYGKTAAQVVLRWQIQHGLSPIPKSVHRGHIAENIDIFDFALSEDEIATIDGLDTDVRAGSDPETVNTRSGNLTFGGRLRGIIGRFRKKNAP